MAIAIKSVPVLKDDVAVRFNSNAKISITKKSTVKFSKQLSISTKILEKAKL